MPLWARRLSASAPVLRELAFLARPGIRAAPAGVQRLIGLREIHPHQAGAVNGGLPLSVTVITTKLVLEACAWLGVQLKRPGLTTAPAGPASKLAVNVWAGKSESLAKRGKLIGIPGSTMASAIGAKAGALFISLTVTLKLLLSVRAGLPLSVTWIARE